LGGVETPKPVWKTSSFLVYTGGLTVLGAGAAALFYLNVHYGEGALTGWALLVLVVLWVLADVLRRRDRWVAAGIFAFTAVIAWGAFVGLAWWWFGWLHNWDRAFGGWSVAHLSLELLILLAAFSDRRRWRFPFITLISATVGWFFITDFVSNGGEWSWVVSFLVGLAYLAFASFSREPSAFWVHLVAGVLVGATLLHWLHSGDVEWAFLGVFAALFIAIGARLRRSSWAVFGAFGLFIIATHYSLVWTEPSGFTSYGPTGSSGLQYLDPTPLLIFGSGFVRNPWAPIVTFAVLGFLLVAFGLITRRPKPLAAPPPRA
jgi:hypothetical protein